ncbi:hypothetical protein ABE543_07010 [Stenotrophomonas sp. TWI169]|uniref:hypothetical protein n=1 Tax=Stenotrophomonas sp. TWI169 TaxID=3136773 RepID=UPI0032081873
MNHELADGAHDRLDAQIAEALFGQPGMSKMDVANRVRELRGDGPALLVGGSHGSEVQVADGPWPEIDAILANAYSAGAVGLPFGGIARRAAARAAVAALSAHPSPGGQGDALPALPYPNYPVSKTGLQNNLYTASQMQDYARAALAALQLVGESMWVEIRREGDRTFPRVMKGDHAEAFLRTCNVGPLPTIHALYAAPPAQAVDLGQIIEQIAQQWDGCAYDAVGETIDVGAAIRAAGKRLIDNQVVGK